MTQKKRFQHIRTSNSQIDRRGFVTTAAAALGGTALISNESRGNPLGQNRAATKTEIPAEDYRITNRRIRQSVMGWCFKPMPMEELINACHAMGMPGVEGVSREHYPLIKKLGMDISLVSSHSFSKGPNDPANQKMCEEKLRESIDVAVEFGAKSVITFTGMSVKGLTVAQQEKNCVDLWKSVVGYAEEKGVTLCLEHLNSRVDSHPMKGHPGYLGDDVDHCVDLIKRVDSPNLKLLFDVYHVQVMNGDVISRINQYHPWIGHYHTAGNPGRGELDETQEINYPAVIRAIIATGYKGFLAQEFIPTWEDKLGALRHGVKVCDV